MRICALSLTLILALLPVLPARAQSRSDSVHPHPFLGRTSLPRHVSAGSDQIRPRPSRAPGSPRHPQSVLALVAAEAPSAAEPILNAPVPVHVPAVGTSSSRILPNYGPWVGVGKWLSLGVGAGLAGLGFALNNEGDDAFRELELLCLADRDACELANDGSYADPALEERYQDILGKDRGARASLVGAQLSFAVSLILFVVDFQRGEGPEDVPYEPEDEKSQVRFSVAPGELTVRYYFK